MLGSNDWKFWTTDEAFVQQYVSLASELISIVDGDKSRLIVMSPPPLQPDKLLEGVEIAVPASSLEVELEARHKRNEVLPSLFEQIKKELKLSGMSFVDAFFMLGGSDSIMPEYFCMKIDEDCLPGNFWGKYGCDRSHPNVEGHRILAHSVKNRIIANYPAGFDQKKKSITSKE